MDAASQDNGRFRLSEREMDDYFSVGWITRKALFSESEVARIIDCFTELERTAAALQRTGPMAGSHFVLGEKDRQQIIKRVVWAGGCQPYLLEIGGDPRLTLPASQLLGSDAMEQLLCQAHFKRPGDGVVFGWHQDIQHRDKGNGTWRDVNGSGSFVQTLIVLDPMTPDGGPLKFIPGSSQWGPVDFGDHDYDDPNSTKQRPPQFDEAEAVTVLADPGDTLFFGPYTAHASFENKSPKYRRVLINGFAYPGANNRQYPGEGAGRRLTV